MSESRVPYCPLWCPAASYRKTLFTADTLVLSRYKSHSFIFVQLHQHHLLHTMVSVCPPPCPAQPIRCWGAGIISQKSWRVGGGMTLSGCDALDAPTNPYFSSMLPKNARSHTYVCIPIHVDMYAHTHMHTCTQKPMQTCTNTDMVPISKTLMLNIQVDSQVSLST